MTANMALGPDGRWTALHSADLWHHARTAGFIYQSVLRHGIAERLSVAFETTDKPGIGEVVGIPKPIRKKFSRRRVAIEAAMIEHGVRTAHGAQIATLDTRPAKPSRCPRMCSGRRGAATPKRSGSISRRCRASGARPSRPTM